jgi:hypothetical protein
MLTKRQRTLALGYARRQAQIAQMVIEMQDIRYKFGSPEGVTLDDAVRQVMTETMLVRARQAMASVGAGQPPSSGDNVLEPSDDTDEPAPVAIAPGSAHECDLNDTCSFDERCPHINNCRDFGVH